MKRRNFLKGILGASALVAVPALAKTETKGIRVVVDGGINQESVSKFGKGLEAIAKLNVSHYKAITQDEIDVYSPFSPSVIELLGKKNHKVGQEILFNGNTYIVTNVNNDSGWTMASIWNQYKIKG